MAHKCNTQRAATEDEFVALGTSYLKKKIQEGLAAKDRVVVGFSGGSTPGPIYEALLQDKDIDWNKVHIFLVDERYIDPNDKDSNVRLVRNAIAKNPSTKFNFIYPDTSLPLQQCVEAYEEAIKKVLGDAPADVLVLGLGPDGHIASLFPPVSEALLEEKRLVTHTTTTTFAVFNRITVTFPVITQAKDKVFFLKSDKKQVWADMHTEPYNPTRWPAHKVIASGNTIAITF